MGKIKTTLSSFFFHHNDRIYGNLTTINRIKKRHFTVGVTIITTKVTTENQRLQLILQLKHNTTTNITTDITTQTQYYSRYYNQTSDNTTDPDPFQILKLYRDLSIFSV